MYGTIFLYAYFRRFMITTNEYQIYPNSIIEIYSLATPSYSKMINNHSLNNVFVIDICACNIAILTILFSKLGNILSIMCSRSVRVIRNLTP